MQILASVSLPMNDLITPWSERVVLEEKQSVWKENKSYMFKSIRCGNAPEMALFPITFECMNYQALNLYYVCSIDFAF